MNNFFSGIKQIEYAYPDMIKIEHNEILVQGCYVAVSGIFSSICIEGLASVEYESKKVSDQDIYTTKLIFRHGKQKVYPYNIENILLNKNLVYRLTDITGKQYLLGINKDPFPAVTVRRVNPNTPTDTNISEYEVTYINIFALLEIISDTDLDYMNAYLDIINK